LGDSDIQGTCPFGYKDIAIIGYKYTRMERKKRDVRFGRERRDTRFGGERLQRRDAWFGDSEWLEDSGVQGAFPFSHHRICTHIYNIDYRLFRLYLKNICVVWKMRRIEKYIPLWSIDITVQ